MQEVFEKIIDELKQESIIVDDDAGHRAVEIIEQFAAEYKGCTLCYLQTPCEYQNKDCKVPDGEINNGWIPCTKEMPPVETEVFILAKRKFKYGDCRYIRTTAMYEDGTVSECDSCWSWEDIEGEWDEENDCYIIPEGWWENRHYNPDEVYNNAVDDEVIAWQLLPPEYQPNICTAGDCPINDGNGCPAAEGCAGYERKQTNADRTIGTQDECREAVEKQKAKKPIIKYEQTHDCVTEIEWKCPVCGTNYVELAPCGEWCRYCGTKLDWGEEK